MMKNFIIYPLVFICLLSCGETKSQLSKYDVARPDEVFELDEDLEEISGLAIKSKTELYALGDEKGKIYILDATSGKIKDKIKFDKEGDYEGVAVKGNTVYAIQSDGDLFQLRNPKKGEFKSVAKFETDLKKNCEGITYDPHSKRLIVACKEDQEDDGFDRGIYTLGEYFGENEHETKFKLYADTVRNLLLDNSFDKFAYEVNDALSSKDDGGILNPSGIAYHPIDKLYYVVNGTSSLLIVIDLNGNITNAVALPSDILPQPEGIAIAENGDLYISSEKSKRKNATLVKYNYYDKARW